MKGAENMGFIRGCVQHSRAARITQAAPGALRGYEGPYCRLRGLADFSWPSQGRVPLRRSLLAPAKQPHGARDGYADWDLAALAVDLS